MRRPSQFAQPEIAKSPALMHPVTLEFIDEDGEPCSPQMAVMLTETTVTRTGPDEVTTIFTFERLYT